MTVLYVCVHNAGRSQMAEAMTRHFAQRRGQRINATSAGTVVGDAVNPVAMQVLAERGIRAHGLVPKPLTQAMVDGADLVITMGCGVDAAACPAKFLVSEDWGLDDPAGQGIEAVRRIADQIEERVQALLDRLS